MLLWTFLQSKTAKKNIMVFKRKKKEIINDDKINISQAANKHIMISEGSCDTEDWSNDDEN